MKTINFYAESVLSSNSLFRDADGKGNVLIVAETGKKDENIRMVLSDFGIDFTFENYWEEMVDVNDFINVDIDEISGKKMEFTKIAVKIDDLEKNFPSLCCRLKENDLISRICHQYLTENNLLDGYALN